MALKHPNAPSDGRGGNGHRGENEWPPLFGLEPGRLSRQHLKRVLPRLEKQPGPVHDHTTGAGFRH